MGLEDSGNQSFIIGKSFRSQKELHVNQKVSPQQLDGITINAGKGSLNGGDVAIKSGNGMRKSGKISFSSSASQNYRSGIISVTTKLSVHKRSGDITMYDGNSEEGSEGINIVMS